MPNLRDIEQMTEHEVYYCLSLLPNSQFYKMNENSIRKNVCIEYATKYLTSLVKNNKKMSALSKVSEESEESDSE